MLSSEFANVHQIYQQIALDFDRTRYALWPRVVSFLQDLPTKSKILDIGCGNGKYLSVRRNDCEVHACDPCAELVAVAQRKHPHARVIEGNGLCLPYENDSFDGVISIAVLHHLSSFERRRTFLQEMFRVLKPGGKGHLTVWAAEKEDNTKRRHTWIHLGDNDYFVPWTLQKHTDNATAPNCTPTVLLQRYYHVFTQDEILELMKHTSETIILTEITLERENWHVTFRKI